MPARKMMKLDPVHEAGLVLRLPVPRDEIIKGGSVPPLPQRVALVPGNQNPRSGQRHEMRWKARVHRKETRRVDSVAITQSRIHLLLPQTSVREGDPRRSRKQRINPRICLLKVKVLKTSLVARILLWQTLTQLLLVKRYPI